MPNWCKYSITCSSSDFRRAATKWRDQSDRFRLTRRIAVRPRTSVPHSRPATHPMSKPSTVLATKRKRLRAASGLDGGVTVSATTFIGDEGHNNSKARPHAAIPARWQGSTWISPRPTPPTGWVDGGSERLSVRTAWRVHGITSSSF